MTVTNCYANQWAGFYMITASVMKELRLKKNSRLRLSSRKLATAIDKWNNIEKQKQTCNLCLDRATENEIHLLLMISS